MGLFKKGLILGGLLAAVAGVGLAMTKEGKELSEEAQNHLKTLSKDVKKGLHKLGDVTQEGYDELVTSVVEKYSVKKELASNVKEELVSALDDMWKMMEAEHLVEQDEDSD